MEILLKSSFHRVLSDLPEPLRKLRISTKFPHQEIRWNFGTHVVTQETLEWRETLFWNKLMKNWDICWGSSPTFNSYYQMNWSAVLNFYAPWNHQKTTGFLVISGGRQLIQLNSLDIRCETQRQSLRISLIVSINGF